MKAPRVLKSFSVVIFLIAAIASIALLYINYEIYQDRNEGYVYRLSTYNEVYQPLPLMVIKTFENVLTDSLKVITSVSKENWMAVRDDGISISSQEYPLLFLPLANQPYIKEFNISSSDLAVSFTMKVQRQETGDIHIINSSMPVVEDQKYMMEDFCDISWIDSRERDSAAAVLKSELKIDTCKSTLGKIQLLAGFIRGCIKKNPDAPLAYSWNTYTAWHIFSKGRAGETSMQCNEYSETFYLFANAAGINTRRVAVAGWADSDGIVKFSGHHFNECYIPEQKKWAFVDITSDKAYVINDTGNVINTYELFVANTSNNYSNLTVVSTKYDSITVESYEDVRQNEEYYFNKDCIIQYKFGNDRFDKWNQAQRYLFQPEPVLSLNYSNDKLYGKYLYMVLGLLAFSAAVISALAVILIYIRKRRV